NSPPLSRSPARAGRLRPASRPPRARLGSTSMRSAPGRDGIVTSRWPCWPMPIWPLCVSTPSGGEDLDVAADCLPLAVPEVRWLIWRLVWARPPDPGRILAWSDWRRRHQQRARRSHWTRRTRTHQPRLWMRDVLGASDHLEGFGQSARIERRIVTGVGAGGHGAQAFLHDHL